MSCVCICTCIFIRICFCTKKMGVFVFVFVFFSSAKTVTHVCPYRFLVEDLNLCLNLYLHKYFYLYLDLCLYLFLCLCLCLQALTVTGVILRRGSSSLDELTPWTHTHSLRSLASTATKETQLKSGFKTLSCDFHTFHLESVQLLRPA